MADFNKPLVGDGYASWETAIIGVHADLARGLDPARTSPTNLPSFTVRWNSANGYWEIFNGTSWSALAATFNINVSSLGGQNGAWYADIPARQGYTSANRAGDTFTGAIAVPDNVYITGFGALLQHHPGLSGGFCALVPDNSGATGMVFLRESAGSLRGARIDLSACAAGAATVLWGSHNFDPATKASLASAAFSGGVSSTNFFYAPLFITQDAGVSGGQWYITSGSGRTYIYEAGSPHRGVYIDIGECIAGTAAKLWHSGNVPIPLEKSATKFSQGFQSADYPVVLGGAYSVAHGLGHVPVFSNVYWVCQTAEYGFNVGDVVSAADALHGTSYASWGGSGVSFDASNIYINIGGTYSCEAAARDGSFYLVDLTPANWKIRVIAWA